jgi:hypothetical protein
MPLAMSLGKSLSSSNIGPSLQNLLGIQQSKPSSFWSPKTDPSSVRAVPHNPDRANQSFTAARTQSLAPRIHMDVSLYTLPNALSIDLDEVIK